MRIARVEVNGAPQSATIEGDQAYRLDDIYGAKRRGEALGALSSLKLLAPAEPKTIVCIGRNYAAHAAESGDTIRDEPIMFFKPPTAVIAPDEDIIWPMGGTDIESEAELVIVIGKQAKLIQPERWRDYVLGYTCGNDVSERHWQDNDNQWCRAKGFDTSCPLGPWIETDLDPDNVMLRGYLNGKLQQETTTADLGNKCGKLVSFISRYITLQPGDFIMTGTPAHPGPMQDGSEYAVEIEGIGRLTNRMRKPARYE